jgi:predicted RNase H-like HicB family nuclease
MFEKPLFIRAEWDEDVNVWVATSDDVPGLATEGDTLEILIKKLKALIPELLFANGATGGLDVTRFSGIYP